MIKRFQLGGKKYRVEYAKGNATGNLGMAYGPCCRIVVQTQWDGKKVPEDSQEQTLYHELIHCVFHEIGREDLAGDEQLVQSAAVLLHQFARTAK